MGICITPQGCMVDVIDSVWGGFADAVRQAAGQMLTQLFGWWTATGSTPVDTAVLRTAQQFVTSWVALPVAVLALLAVVAWGVAAGGDGWLRDTVRGLVVFGIAAAGSIPIVGRLQDWSESLAEGVLSAVPTGDVGQRFISMLDLPGVGPGQVFFWSGLLFLAGAVQYLLMLFRDGAVLLLTLIVPLAAAGQFSRGSIRWLPKVSGWLLVFIFMKPAAALVYYLGLTLLGSASGVQSLATGVCLMVAAVLALPAMLRLVTFAVEAAPLHGNALGTAATATGIAASTAQVISRFQTGSGGSVGVGPSGAGQSPGGVVGTGATGTPPAATGAAGTAGGSATASVPVAGVAVAAVDAASNLARRTATTTVDPASAGSPSVREPGRTT